MSGGQENKGREEGEVKGRRGKKEEGMEGIRGEGKGRERVQKGWRKEH